MTKKEKTDPSEKSKDLFISIASHKLFTPITVIKLRIELLLNDRSLTKSVRGQLNETLKSVAKLEDFANVLLRISDVIEVKDDDIREINVKKLITAVISDFTDTAMQKKIKFKIDYDKNTLIKVNFKDSYLRYILSSIIENSIKYGKDGGHINVECSISNKKVNISVADDGAGIPENELNMLFRSFFRGTNVQKLDVNGYGLSLYTVKLLVDRLGGKIRGESRESAGTKFTIEFKNNS
ncbi:hypothetical protein A2982_04245 [candidate division WWE3 bacterium RIFCSPLOWO2_01_FULL_39_13]|uniref:histidine kinase n=1 Tax=candidate division WWE3 bacterium RIFCSPLOWO2_01_FULL_39_13 TaxID=1802624 RepID=A0A1F4V282_UNCKA|nr:MAG: hypothetical protein A2982_04245 [candidate division WWE3 bacterium RIFCSPLOWO2_01_FULL_39_13]